MLKLPWTFRLRKKEEGRKPIENLPVQSNDPFFAKVRASLGFLNQSNGLHQNDRQEEGRTDLSHLAVRRFQSLAASVVWIQRELDNRADPP